MTDAISKRIVCLPTLIALFITINQGERLIKIEYSGKTTPEYVLLLQNQVDITETVEAEIDEVVRDLHAARVIPSQKIGDDVMNKVLPEVARSPHNFYAFLYVLEKRNVDDRYSKLLEKIDSGFLDEMKRYIPSGSSSQSQGSGKCDVFLSFSRKRPFGDSPDSEKQAHTLHDMLEEEGVRTWIDNELNLGDSITEEVFTALRQCQAIVPVVTRGFAQSISSLREFYFFSLTHSYKQVYPLLSDVDQLEREKAGRWLNKRVTALMYFKFEQAKDLVKSLKEKYVNEVHEDRSTVPASTTSTPEHVPVTHDPDDGRTEGKSSTQRGHTEIKEILDLYQAVKNIGNWKGLCVNLRVAGATMNMLEYSTDNADSKKLTCLHAYFNNGEAIWEDVVRAVREYPINNNREANAIEAKYILKRDEL